jgi:hypothetical protein
MDAATLYMVLTLPNGEQRTSTQKFATLEACEAQVESLDRQQPVTSYRCGDTIRLISSLAIGAAIQVVW